MQVDQVIMQDKQLEDDSPPRDHQTIEIKAHPSPDVNLPTDMSDTTESEGEKNNKYVKTNRLNKISKIY